MRIKAAILVLVIVALGVSFLNGFSKGFERVNDGAKIFTQEAQEGIDSYHKMMLDQFDIDYRVITTREKIDIDSFSARQFKEHTIGSESKTSRGLLMVIDVQQDRVRLEVSANIESVFTDAFIAYVEKRQMVPFFNLGRVADGVLATGEILRIRALDAQKGEEFDPIAYAGSMGGGAQTAAGIGKGRDNTFAYNKTDVLAATTPEETLQRYFSALGARNGRRDLDVFTPESRKYMGGMVGTPAQMDNTYKRYKLCELDRVVYSDDGKRAVLLHLLSNRSCDPFTFQLSADGKWRLDLRTIGLGLGHTYGNVWYINRASIKESGIWKYYFGFRDYWFWSHDKERFDHQRFPAYRSWGIHMNHVTLGAVMYNLHGTEGYLYKSGIRERDIILRWEGIEYPHNQVIFKRMTSVREGLDVDMLVQRGDKQFHLIMKAPPKPTIPKKLRWSATFRSTGSRYPVVHYIRPDSVGDKIGLQAGDVIIGWNHVKLPTNMRPLFKIMRTAKAGDPVTIVVVRDGEKLTLKGTAEPRRIAAKVK